MALVPLQQADPIRYKAFIENTLQPGATLNATNASAGAAGASATAAMESAKASRLTQQENQHKLDIIKFLADTKSYFDKNAGGDKKVSPQDYNTKKQEASGLGVPGNDFDQTFEQSYTNPQNYNYDTPANFDKKTAYQQTKNALQAQIDAYNSVPEDQKGLWSKSAAIKDPIFGMQSPLGKIIAPQATEYLGQLQGLSTKLSDIAGAGVGSGMRITQTELNNWANLMPSPTKSKTQNDYDLSQLNRLVEAKFGKGNGLDEGYTPSSKSGNARPPLSSFHE